MASGLSKKQKKCTKKCPECGSRDTDYEVHWNGYGKATYINCECEDCGAEWECQ